MSHIAIVGGGFSGTLLAINLLRFDGPPATLIERDAGRLGRGVAYSATEPSHLLNVRAAGMSAFADDPDHFVRWLGDHGTGTSFVPRQVYGRYLAETLAELRTDRLSTVEGDAVDLDPAGVRLADGRLVAADTVVLATGNLPPHTPPGIDPAALPDGRYLDDPWRAEPGEGLGPDDTVVLLGTGLTAVDVALQLDAGGYRGRILALSRRGLRPRRHRDGAPPPAGHTDLPDLPLSRLVRRVREEAEGGDWRAAVDRFRPITQAAWGASSGAERSRFLRHLRPFWDVHRHRLAPAVADRIDAMVADNRLRFAAGKVVSGAVDGDGVRLTWRPRRDAGTRTDRVARIVNCTGPQGDLTRTDDPLLARLVAEGRIRPDRFRLGIDVDERLHVLDRDGRADDALFCVGPMTKGALWEVVAVPDIRGQVNELARRLAEPAPAL